jgi:hypothetical protein
VETIPRDGTILGQLRTHSQDLLIETAVADQPGDDWVRIRTMALFRFAD